MLPLKKYAFEEIVSQITVFYNDDKLEKRFDDDIKEKVSRIIEYDKHGGKKATVEYVVEFVRTEDDGLERLVYLLDISKEKFMRIVTLLRRLEDNVSRDWSMKKIIKEIKNDDTFAGKIADLLVNGAENKILKKHIPRYYHERLNLQKLSTDIPLSELLLKMKTRYYATYSSLKGAAIEELIRSKLNAVQNKHGISYASGICNIIDVTTDFSIPSLKAPYIVIMSSYQETTSSAQSTKARDMIHSYEQINHRNIQYHENRAFVNFVDGGGWLARIQDLKRIVDGCHYCLTIKSLDMLENIVVKHVPKKYWKGEQTKLG